MNRHVNRFWTLIIVITACHLSLPLQASFTHKGIISPKFLFKRYESTCNIRHELKPYISKANNESSLDIQREKIQTFLKKITDLILYKNQHIIGERFNNSDFCIDVYDKWSNAVSMISEDYYGQIHFGANLFTAAKYIDEVAFILSHELAHFFMSHTNSLDGKGTLILHPSLYNKENLKVFKRLDEITDDNRNIYSYYAPLYLDVEEKRIEVSEYLYQLQQKSIEKYGFEAKYLEEIEADEIGAHIYINSGFEQSRDLLLFTIKGDKNCKQDNKNSNSYLATCTRNSLINKILPNQQIYKDNNELEKLQEEFLDLKRDYEKSYFYIN